MRDVLTQKGIEVIKTFPFGIAHPVSYDRISRSILRQLSISVVRIHPNESYSRNTLRVILSQYSTASMHIKGHSCLERHFQ